MTGADHPVDPRSTLLCGVSLAGLGGLLGRRGPGRGRSGGRRGPAQLATLLTRHSRVRFAPAAPGLVPAPGLLVDRGPGPPLGLALRDAAFFIPLFDVLGRPLLLARVTALVAAWHDRSPIWSVLGRHCTTNANRMPIHAFTDLARPARHQL